MWQSVRCFAAQAINKRPYKNNKYIKKKVEDCAPFHKEVLKTPTEPSGSVGVTHYTFYESCVKNEIVEMLI